MTPELLLDGLRFAECPRWHDGKLWFSDIYARRVVTVTPAGESDVVVQLGDDDLPAGLGFLPDGRLLIANLARPVVLRLDADGSVSTHADLSGIAVGPLNDMVVDPAGRAYVGASGVDELSAPRPLVGTGSIIRVDPDGSARIVAPEMDSPNGPVITADGKQYVVASLPARELTGFDIAADGSLSGRRVWADLQPAAPDGITVDAENGVWICAPLQRECRRVLEGGEVTDVIALPDRLPIAPCLGGDDGRTLFILSVTTDASTIADMTCESVIESVRVDVPAPR
ncbi:SMP-30/gluconolactonase/LRE family protein [Pseudonocardia benzenivorans]|jgi:sugar lactone lactonase YvrE|uniref:SMP-30/Gluconolaconase/LRE-like region-containing protein n=2 Tax=Pseudonocardia TaxID=1847 RepID=F4CMI4_PSEUX|nr:SMP-30/gluconolactonase/LRE family protein [Pseudonocardia dioxanivorans]AEA23611.1 SMP-30/Gluconolaconase/LRE-like region-containing protein [Pseudonocardia dioxanivorans CB1190]GJF05989.1 gluconolactonase [Pseudonocardia sp. D17]